MKRDDIWQRTRRKRVCPKCGAAPEVIGVDGAFKLQLECPKCGHRFTGANAKVVEE